MNSPSLPDVTTVSRPVWVWTAFIVADATGAPDGSVTVPVIVPYPWPYRPEAERTMNIITTTAQATFRRRSMQVENLVDQASKSFHTSGWVASLNRPGLPTWLPGQMPVYPLALSFGAVSLVPSVPDKSSRPRRSQARLLRAPRNPDRLISNNLPAGACLVGAGGAAMPRVMLLKNRRLTQLPAGINQQYRYRVRLISLAPVFRTVAASCPAAGPRSTAPACRRAAALPALPAPPAPPRPPSRESCRRPAASGSSPRPAGRSDTRTDTNTRRSRWLRWRRAGANSTRPDRRA